MTGATHGGACGRETGCSWPRPALPTAWRCICRVEVGVSAVGVAQAYWTLMRDPVGQSGPRLFSWRFGVTMREGDRGCGGDLRGAARHPSLSCSAQPGLLQRYDMHVLLVSGCRQGGRQ